MKDSANITDVQITENQDGNYTVTFKVTGDINDGEGRIEIPFPNAGGKLIWVICAKMITLNPNGGKFIEKLPNGTTEEITRPVTNFRLNDFNESNDFLNSISKEGSEFSGWYTAATGGTKITSDNVSTLKNGDTLYAHWGGEASEDTDTSIKTEVNASEDAPAIKVDNLDDELAAKLLTDEETEEYENGTPVLVYLDVEVVDKADVPAADLTAVEKVIDADGYTYGECLDLSLWKKLGDGTPTQIHDTNGNPIKITVTIPDTMKNAPAGYTRTFRIIRVHDGVATVMAEGTGATLEISSDKFSSYFLVYKDAKTESAASTSDAATAAAATVSPKTGDAAPITALIVCMLSAAGAFVLMDLKKKKN